LKIIYQCKLHLIGHGSYFLIGLYQYESINRFFSMAAIKSSIKFVNDTLLDIETLKVKSINISFFYYFFFILFLTYIYIKYCQLGFNIYIEQYFSFR